jgi:hypothetical protein
MDDAFDSGFADSADWARSRYRDAIRTIRCFLTVWMGMGGCGVVSNIINNQNQQTIGQYLGFWD